MKTREQGILKKEKVFVGLEDSKKTWQLCVRSGGVIVHETSMPAKFEVLRNYFNNKFPECQIQVIYAKQGLRDSIYMMYWKQMAGIALLRRRIQ